MKMFPVNNYTLELNYSVEKSFELIKINTSESSSLSTHITNKMFIGKVDTSSFQIISSEIGIGACTVFKGDFSNGTLIVATEINKPFKILIIILSAFILIGFGFAFFINDFPESIGLLIPLSMAFLLIRFVLIGLFNKLSSDLTFGKLKNVLNIKPM